jgi:hypothetical protein
MRLHCRAIWHFLDCYGNISSLRGIYAVEGKVVRLVRVAFSNDGALWFEPLPFSLFFSFLFFPRIDGHQI